MTASLPLRERKKERTRAAIEAAAARLFATRGFDAVTLVEVAEAADVGHRTLFRYFADKEELLFGDDSTVREVLAGTLQARPPQEGPSTAAREALAALAPLWQGSREEGRQRRAIISGSVALVARERAKHAAYEQVVCHALMARGLVLRDASLLASVSVVCFQAAVGRWFDDEDPDEPGLAGRIRGAFDDLTRLSGTGSTRL